MVIEGITGGKPQEIRKAEQNVSDRKQVETGKQSADKPEAKSSATAEVSDRSKAAIKAYRIATESKPDLSRADRVAQIKQQVEAGTYHTSSSDVADAIIKNVASGS